MAAGQLLFCWNFSYHEAIALDFLSKHPEQALDFVGYVVEASKGWDDPNPREMEIMRPQSSTRGGMYSLPKDMDMKSKVSTLARRLEELEMRN